jgi:RHS repeat-associated protein
LEQSITSYFDAAGRAVTNINSLGEVTITTMDALGRTTSTLINSASGALVREKYFAYSADHNSVTVTDGSGANAISHTTYTDTGGNPVLSIAYPATGTLDYKRMVYDLAGNLAYEEHDTTPGNVWTFAGYAHDGLNSLTFETNRDDAVTAYVHDPLGDVTNRVMPGGLQWDAIYNHAGQVQQDWLVGTGNVGTRTNTYTYFASGTPFAGLLNTMTDGRGLVSTYGYDDRLRQTSISRTDSNYGQVNTAWSYDARGYATNITEQYTTNDLGNYNPKVITRAFDPYGQLSSETVSVGGSGFSSASQNWDAAGRRTGLSINDAVYGFSSRADGALIYASDPTGSGSYAYDTAGVLTNRAVGSRTTSITARDGEGRPSTIATAINGASLMTETLGWNGDGTLNADTLYRPDFTDSRIYTYASLTRRLTQEQINLNASTTWTNSFAYDGGTASGPGVLTQMGVPGSSSVNWTGGESPFSSVNAETNTCITYSANGWVNGDSALQAFLDGRSQAIFTNALGNSTNLNAFQWHANMELTPGAHQLKVAALHPSGFYTAWATNSFTNGIAGQTDALTRDAGGNITLRVWLKPNGTTNHQQQLSWDAKNRLTDLIDVDSTQTGYHWHAEYDALDRRLFTSCTVYTNGQDPNLSPVIIDQFYDPMVEFLELGVAYGDQSIFKLYGPDMNGRYGGLNGTGGFDGFSSYLNTFTPVISDFRGNILAEVTNNYFVAWTPARPTGFGAVPGYRPSALGHGADISLASAWRGRWVDISGYYNLGKRVYDPVAGMWLSYDPSWNDADPNYLSFAGGDPINRFDGDGRCALYAGEKALTGIAQFFASASNEEDARPIDEIYQEQYDANYKYYGNNAWYAMNATYNPAVGTELAASEMINGQGLNYYNSGQTLTDNQRVDAAFNFGSGTAATVGTAALLEGAGALSVNAVSSYLAPSLDDSLPSTFNVAGSQNAGNAGTPPPMGTVYVSPPPDATPAQIQQVQAYATGANEAIQQGLLMNGRVSTAGALRQAASRAAATERSSAAAAGTPYQGQVGHVPDTTWTGTPQPYSWLDLDPAVNASIGGQANGYPLGFVPTDFQPSN